MQANVPAQVTAGVTIFIDDLRTTHEEAYYIVVQQCLRLVEKIDCDACNFFLLIRTDIKWLIGPTQAPQTVTDIGEIVREHMLLVPSLLEAHALPGCDSVCGFQNVGEKTIIKTLHKKTLIYLEILIANLKH